MHLAGRNNAPWPVGVFGNLLGVGPRRMALTDGNMEKNSSRSFQAFVPLQTAASGSQPVEVAQ